MMSCMKKFSAVVVLGLLVTAAPVSAQLIVDRPTLDAILGAGQIFENFEAYSINDGDAHSAPTASLDFTTIFNGQGPGLVQPGAVYNDPAQAGLQWNGHNYYGLQSKTLLSNSNTLAINYTTAVVAMGLDLRGFEGFGWNGEVRVYDVNNALVSTTNVGIANGGAENLFFGWYHAGGIGRVEIFNATHSWGALIDNHGYGVPAPGALALLAAAGVMARRRRRG